MAIYFPPVRNSNDPGATLDDHPCISNHCLSEHELLATLVFLMAAFADAGTPDELEAATKRFRNMSKVDMLAFMNASFSDALISTANSEALKCLTCYSDQKLKEMFVYLWKRLLALAQ